MTEEEERQLFSAVFQSGHELDGLIQCLDYLIFAHFSKIDVTREEITALTGLTAAFKDLSKRHIKDITTFNDQLD